MESFKLYVEKLSRRDLDDVERNIDKVFADLGIDVEFTRHFIDRVNDERNGKDITKDELEDLFIKAKEKYGRKIHSMKPSHEAVLTDLGTWVNLPFVLNKVGNELELVAKTVMRKKNFLTRTKKLFV
jgi:hypothetical protein